MSIFVPSTSLTRQVGPDGLVLNLATQDWFQLQANIQAVTNLPSNLGEYATRYGDPSSGMQMKSAFDAMDSLRSVASSYGSPMTLRKSVTLNPNILAVPNRPRGDAFLATAWTLQQAHADASRLSKALALIPETARGAPAAEVVAGIKSLFLDTDQILDGVLRTEASLGDLITEMQDIEDALGAAQEEMASYTSKSSKTMTFLNTEIGELEEKIKQLENSRDAAWQKWIDLTISAVVVPAGIGIIGTALMVVLVAPTSGGSLLVGGAITTALAGVAATALAVAAGVARTDYDGLVEEVSSVGDLKRKRIAYRHDLGALDTAMQITLPASSGVTAQLKGIKNAWGALGREMREQVSGLTESSLSNGPWLDQTQMSIAANNWGRVDGAIRAFSINSFIDGNLLPFGGSVEADDPKWQESFTRTVAA